LGLRASVAALSGNRTISWFGRGEPKQLTELRRLFTTFGYLVAKQGVTVAIGLVYWAVVTRLFTARDVGLAAAAASTALLLAAIGGLEISLLLAEIGPIEAAERRVIFTTGRAIAGFVVLILSISTMIAVSFPWEQSETALRLFGPANEANGLTALRILILVGRSTS
jgi:O-antigen/teichoic acid export membrane protein